MAWVSETGPCKLVRDAVIFAVHMPNGPIAPSLGKLLAQVSVTIGGCACERFQGPPDAPDP